MEEEEEREKEKMGERNGGLIYQTTTRNNRKERTGGEGYRSPASTTIKGFWTKLLGRVAGNGACQMRRETGRPA